VSISTATSPFNPFARLVAGLLPAPYGNHLQRLGMATADSEFFVAQNRPELDAAWASTAPDMVGKASMAQRHQFLLLRDLTHWQAFNVLTLGMSENEQTDTPASTAARLHAALELLRRMESVAREYAQRSRWSAHVGLFFHAFPFNSVQAMHLHMLDMSTAGPTFEHLNHKNLSLEDVTAVLQQEIDDAEQKQQQN